MPQIRPTLPRKRPTKPPPGTRAWSHWRSPHSTLHPGGWYVTLDSRPRCGRRRCVRSLDRGVCRRRRPASGLRHAEQQHLRLTGSARELREGLRHLAQLVGLEHGLRPSVRFPRDLRLALLEAGQYPLDAELEFVQSVCGGDLLGSPHRSLGAPEAAEARLTDPLLQVEVRADVRWHVVHARLALLPPAGKSHTVATI